MERSPFAPTFGSWPPVLAGRSDLEDELSIALSDGPRHEWYTTLIVGSRGTGKTVALSLAVDVANQLGFHTIYELAQPGMLNRVAAQLAELEGKPVKRRRKVSATLGVPGASVTATSETLPDIDRSLEFRAALESATRRVVGAGSAGILLAVDEIHDVELAELSVLGGALQILSRMGELPVAFVGAGLPDIDQLVLDSTGTTFLERCARYDTGALTPAQTRRALEEPFVEAGVEYSRAGMDVALAATAGHPFAIQAIGHHIWAKHGDPRKQIAEATFAAGTERAISSMGRQVAQPVWKRLSDQDRQFVRAMAAYGEDVVPVSYLAIELERTNKWVSRYRDRLIKASVVSSAGRGLVSFTHPAFRPWVRAKILELEDGPVS